MFFQFAVVPANLVAQSWVPQARTNENSSSDISHSLSLSLSLPALFVFCLFNSKHKCVTFSGQNCSNRRWMNRILLCSQSGKPFVCSTDELHKLTIHVCSSKKIHLIQIETFRPAFVWTKNCSDHILPSKCTIRIVRSVSPAGKQTAVCLENGRF